MSEETIGESPRLLGDDVPSGDTSYGRNNRIRYSVAADRPLSVSFN